MWMTWWITDEWAGLTDDVMEMGRALSEPLNLGMEDPEWEDEIEAELDEMTKGAALEEATTLTHAMPSVPTHTIKNNNNGGDGEGKEHVKTVLEEQIN